MRAFGINPVHISTFQSEGGSAVGIATGYRLLTEGSEFEYRQGQEFSLLHIFQTGSGAHTASHAIGTEVSFSWGKTREAWSWPLISN
jgi:hypothetical protein